MVAPTLNQRIVSNWKWLLLISVFWILLFLRGYPAPFIDDAWYAAAGISLAQQGTFSNLICDHVVLIGSGPLFLAYLPWHDYVLGGWLKILGVSTLSICSFYTLLAWANCVIIFCLLPPSRHPLLVAAFICMAVYVLLGGAGTRPDALGLFFFVCGVDLYRTLRPGVFFVKSLCLAMAMITMANVALLALIVPVAALAYQKFSLQRSTADLLKLIFASGAAYALGFVLFLWCIDFRLHDLLTCLNTNHHMAANGVQDRFFRQIFSFYGAAKWWVIQSSLLISLVLYYQSNRTEQSKANRLIFFFAMMAAFGALGWVSFSSASGSHWWAFSCLMVILFLAQRYAGGRIGALALTLLLGTFVVGHGHYVVEDLLCSHQIDEANNRKIIAEVDAMHPPKIYADEYAWRKIYDYRLPVNGYDFETCGTFEHGTALENLPKGSVAIISVRHAAELPTDPRSRPLKIFGFGLWALYANPYDLVLIDNR